MARNTTYSKEILLESSVEYIRKNGINNFNIRDLAKFVGCSTQPFFKYYNNLNEFKVDLKQYLHLDYERFIKKYVDENHYLLTISYGYALYAKYEPNIFYALFITDLAGSRTVEEVLNTGRNIATIYALMKEYNIDKKEADDIYRDVRFYTHGIACQLCINSIKLDDKVLYDYISNNIKLHL